MTMSLTSGGEPGAKQRAQLAAARILGLRARTLEVLHEQSVRGAFVLRDEESAYVVKHLSMDERSGDAQRVTLLAEAEAAAAAGLEPEIVMFERVEVDRRDGLWLARRYVEGTPLSVELRAAPFPVARAISVAKEIAALLARLHGAGVIHRNLKPTNVILRASNGELCLLDAGLAYSATLYASARAETLARYCAPELTGDSVAPSSEATDLYLLGIVLFELLIGEPPFRGATPAQTLHAQRFVGVPSLRSRGVDVPRAVEQILEQLLAKEPQERGRSARSVYEALERIERDLRGSRCTSPEPLMEPMRRIGEPRFVGRERELAALVRSAVSARTGDGELACVRAESGGGKTRLLDELAARCRERGFWVLRGRGRDLVAVRPFAVLDDVVGEMTDRFAASAESAARVRERLGASADAVVRIFPGLRPVLARATPSDDAPEAFAEMRAVSALAQLLDALGTKGAPALVVLDDCQWTDDASLKLLQRWAAARRTQTGRYTSVVLAFRRDEVASDGILYRLPARHIDLAPLSDNEVRALLESMAGGLPGEVTDFVVRFAQGNPFMASALLRGLVESGVLDPAAKGWTVRSRELAALNSSNDAVALLHRRLDLLSAEAIRTLTAAALLGKQFPAGLVASLAELPAETVRAALAEALRRHIVWMSGRAGEFGFTHDKLRETLLARLADEDRRRLHARAAELLVRDDAGGATARAYEIAYHFGAAKDFGQAFPFAMAAARDARRRYALGVAERYYRLASEGLEGRTADEAYEALVGLGDVQMLRGAYREAADTFGRAQPFAADRLQRAELEGRVGELSFKRGEPREAAGSIVRALGLLGARVPQTRLAVIACAGWEVGKQALHTAFPRVFLHRCGPATREARVRMRLYSRLAYAFWFTRGVAATLWAHLCGMNLAELYDPSRELAQAYSEHAPVATTIPMLERGRRYAEKSLRLRSDLGDRWGRGQSLHFLGIVHYAAGRYQDVIRVCREAARILERTGDRWEAHTASWHIASAMYRLGDFAAAIDEARRIYEGALEIGDAQSRRIALSIWMKAAEGRGPTRLLAEELPYAEEDAHAGAELLVAEAIRALHDDDVAQAVAVLGRAIRLIRSARMRQEYVAPVWAWQATVSRLDAEQALPWEQGAGRGSRRRMRKAVRHALWIARWYRNNQPHALREAGYLAALEGRDRQARRAFDRSLAVARELRALYEQALTFEAIARVGERRGWPQAKTARAQSQQLFERVRSGVDDALA